MNADNQKIAYGLRVLAEELRPFTLSSNLRSKVWDGTAYASAEPLQPDVNAIAWWSTLISIAEMIERQECSPSKNQLTYLMKLLFGGMGSFSDFFLDTKKYGNAATEVNNRIQTKLAELYQLLTSIMKRFEYDV